MKADEFIEVTSRLETYYGKEYTNEQRAIMFDELKHLDINRYKQLVSLILKRSKFLPKIADFIELNKEEPYAKKQDENEKVDCKICNETGYVTYKKVINNGTGRKIINEYGAICKCRQKPKYEGWEVTDYSHKSDYYIPYIEEI